MGKDHCGPTSRGSNSLLPWTVRSPRFTRVSEGYPFLRLLVTSKAGERFEVVMVAGHTNLPVGVKRGEENSGSLLTCR